MPRSVDLAVFTVAAAAFCVGAAPWIHWYDSAELATAAWQLAVSHPPGQPLHSVLGKAAALVPFGPITFRTNLLSALCAAAAVAGTGALGRVVLGTIAPTATRRAQILATVGPALAIGAAASLLGQATRTEVYATAYMLAIWGDVFAIEAVARGGIADARKLAGAALFAGLGASVHPAAGIAVVLAAAWAVCWIAPWTLLRWRILLWSFVATAIGLFVLAYLPARTGPGVIPTWESLRAPEPFYRYAIGEAYRINAQGGLAALAAMGAALRSVVVRTGVLPAIFWLSGIAWLGFRKPRWAVAILGATILPVVLLSVSAFEEENPDLQGYLLPVFGVYLASLAPVLFATLSERIAYAIAAVSLAVATVLGFGRAEWRLGYDLPDVWTHQALSEPPPRSLVVVESDHVVFATSYAQIVEGARPDCGFLTGGFAHLERHLDEVHARRPFPRPIEFDGTGEWRQRRVRGLLKSLAGLAPRVVERAVWDPPSSRSLGIFFTMDPGDPPVPDAPYPRALDLELARGGAGYVDGGDRIVWRVRYERGQSFWGRGRFRAGVEELLSGLRDARIDDETRRGLLELQDGAPESPYALTPMMTRPWIADERLLRTELARLVTRAGRPDLGVPLLDDPSTDGDPEALLLDCELRMAEAPKCYEALRRRRRELGPLCDVGLSRVRIREGKLDEARSLLERGKESADAWALSFAGSVEIELGNAEALLPE